jgi:hypothetical protein
MVACRIGGVGIPATLLFVILSILPIIQVEAGRSSR